jgi:hypothetical protein
MEIKIKMPDELKSYIVDDWEQICKHKATNNSFFIRLITYLKCKAGL